MHAQRSPPDATLAQHNDRMVGQPHFLGTPQSFKVRPSNNGAQFLPLKVVEMDFSANTTSLDRRLDTLRRNGRSEGCVDRFSSETYNQRFGCLLAISKPMYTVDAER